MYDEVSTGGRDSLPERMETKGIEPSFRRCDRHVLPLHHVPKIIYADIVSAVELKSSVT